MAALLEVRGLKAYYGQTQSFPLNPVAIVMSELRKAWTKITRFSVNPLAKAVRT